MSPATEVLAGVDLDQVCTNTIRTLSIDVVQQAMSGHEGAPMAPAPLVCRIWNRVMRRQFKALRIWQGRETSSSSTPR